MYSSPLVVSRDSHLLGVDSRRERSSGLSVCNKDFLFRYLNTRIRDHDLISIGTIDMEEELLQLIPSYDSQSFSVVFTESGFNSSTPILIVARVDGSQSWIKVSKYRFKDQNIQPKTNKYVLFNLIFPQIIMAFSLYHHKWSMDCTMSPMLRYYNDNKPDNTRAVFNEETGGKHKGYCRL